MKPLALTVLAIAVLLSGLYLAAASRLSDRQLPVGAKAYSVFGTDIYATDEGSGEPTIVLIHGGGGSIADWERLRPILRERHRIVTVDRPENGWSGPHPSPPDDYLVANASILAELLRQIGVNNSVVVGSSYGGAVGLRLALDEPDLVRSFIHFCGMAPGYDPFASSVGGVLRLGGWVDRPVLGSIFDRALRPGLIALSPRSWWMEAQFGESWTSVPEETLERTLVGMLPPKLIAVRETSQVQADLARLAPRLPELTQPTLIISGALDTVIPPEVGEQLGAILPNSERRILSDAGHTHYEVDPDAIAALLSEFAQRP